TKKPAPLLLNISFITNGYMVDDPDIKPGQVWDKEGHRVAAPAPKAGFNKIDIGRFIDAGFGFATFCYTDVEADMPQGIKYGVLSLYLKNSDTAFAPDEWGSIAAWSWGMSRVMDYLETDPMVDKKRVAITGASRLGKTIVWTGARDTRFAVVIASISGEGGAALSRRNYGETIGHLTAPGRYYYQFAGNYKQYANDVSKLPFDSHCILALIAPRPLLLQTGNTDYWSDPKGEYMAALAARPVYQLYNKQGPTSEELPAAGDTSQLLHPLGYFMHEGGHAVLSADWGHFIEFMKKYL
ncbi:MAG: acetylxylan esterase, partial [Bacteroidetes bacterium]|nr:acetylxylan esterase [Bacteroidota bacterium]